MVNDRRRKQAYVGPTAGDSTDLRAWIFISGHFCVRTGSTRSCTHLPCVQTRTLTRVALVLYDSHTCLLRTHVAPGRRCTFAYCPARAYFWRASYAYARLCEYRFLRLTIRRNRCDDLFIFDVGRPRLWTCLVLRIRMTTSQFSFFFIRRDIDALSYRFLTVACTARTRTHHRLPVNELTFAARPTPTLCIHLCNGLRTRAESLRSAREAVVRIRRSPWLYERNISFSCARTMPQGRTVSFC